jgi:hypothetical protein
MAVGKVSIFYFAFLIFDSPQSDWLLFPDAFLTVFLLGSGAYYAGREVV